MVVVTTLALGFSGDLAAHSLSQTSMPPDNDLIIVTGERLTRAQFRERAAAFVRGAGVARGLVPAARWVQPVCLKVLGLQDEHASIVETAMRGIAAATGVPVARGPCTTNTTVTFTGDAGALVREVARRSPRRLHEVPAGARAALLDGRAPVRWWYLTETRSRHGMASAQQMLNVAGGDTGGSEGGSSAGTPISVEAIQHYDSSVISTQVGRTLASATVVVDVNAATGQSLEAVSAYAAMVAFAEIREADYAPSGSILGLFGSPGPSDGMTGQDLAFLRALYRIPLDRVAMRHRGMLVTGMVEAATDSPGGHPDPD
jgi:hypothetical protein